MTSRIRLIVLVCLLAVLVAGPRADVPPGDLLHAVRVLSQPLRQPADLEPVIAAVGSARVVLLGEASHGTHEFYVWRDRLSRRLIAGEGFAFVAIEGDWAALLPLDRYVRHLPGAPGTARAALLGVARWPRWVWANRELEALGEWLHAFNADRSPRDRVGIHGIDLYAIWESLDAVQAFYDARLPQAADRVRRLYAPLRDLRGDYRGYADQVGRGGQAARDQVVRVVQDLAARYREATGPWRELLFTALQHARVVAAGEAYLRLASRPGPASWNARAAHFADTLHALLAHYGRGSRAIVWAHNTHVGDARATDMRLTGEVNLGQLARERYGRHAVFVLGFGTGIGSVLAARQWEGARETMQTPAPRPDSLEAALLASGAADRVLLFDRSPATDLLRRATLPHRAIGVVFAPHREPWKNYIPTRLAARYDGFVFLPRTRALEALHANGRPPLSGAARPTEPGEATAW